MPEPKFYSPFKIGLLIVVTAYFLFTFHALFTLPWIGEWEYFGGGSIVFWIFITDVSAYFGLVFRFMASLIAFVAILAYFAKKGMPTQMVFRILRWVLIFEAIYWMTLFVSGLWGVLPASVGGFSGTEGLSFNIVLLITTGIPCLFSSLAIPITLLKLVQNLGTSKPAENQIRLSLIAGAIYIFVFWLNNAGMWISTLLTKGSAYLSAYPVNLLSFALTMYGLPALAIFTAYFTGKTIKKEIRQFELKTLGAIITALGLYFLWNYLSWIFFGGDYLWSDWYAWFLGHNLDLWLISLPLLGLPLLFKEKLVDICKQN